ncbi:unnamed protein product [Chrysoparadoxa australica]
MEARDHHGFTPLMLAAKGNDLDSLLALLAAGADVEARDDEGNDSALHGSVALGHLRIVEALLQHKADVAARNRQGFTPLMVAAVYNKPECALALLNASADTLDRSPEEDETSLHLAVRLGHLRMVNLLLQHMPASDLPARNGMNPIMLAASHGKLDCAQAVIASGANLEGRDAVDGGSSLHIACTRGHAAMTELLLRHGADKNGRTNLGTTPLMLAAKHDNLDCMQALVAADANLQASVEGGITALHAVAIRGSLRGVRLLLRHKADPDAGLNGVTPAVICRRAWAHRPQLLRPGAEAAEERKAVVEALNRASLANRLWRGRKVIVMLAARHTGGQIITDGATGDLLLESTVLWLVARQGQGMEQVYRYTGLLLP